MLTPDAIHVDFGASIQGAKIDITTSVILHPIAPIRVEDVVDNDIGKGKEEARETSWISMFV